MQLGETGCARRKTKDGIGMATTFGEAARQGLTNAAASQEQSTANSGRYPHFLKCLRLWEAMMPKKAGDEVSGELLAKGYWQVLGSKLTEQEMNALTELVLERCKWFPTVAECRELMAESTYANPFYVARLNSDLARNGYLPSSDTKRLTDRRE